jgi:hypothetical protein
MSRGMDSFNEKSPSYVERNMAILKRTLLASEKKVPRKQRSYEILTSLKEWS